MLAPHAKPETIKMSDVMIIAIWDKDGNIRINTDLDTPEVLRQVRALEDMLAERIVTPAPRSEPIYPYVRPRTLSEPGESYPAS